MTWHNLIDNAPCDPHEPPTGLERASLGLAMLSPLLGMLLIAAVCGGCVSNKASHQHGIVAYVSTSGQLGVGYGETEDLPGGCTFERIEDVWTCTAGGMFTSAATNHTHTVTRWDTTKMCVGTNGVASVVASEVTE